MFTQLLPAAWQQACLKAALPGQSSPPLQASCLDKGGVCIVAALAVDSTSQAAQLEVLRGAAAGRGDQPLSFSWFAAGNGAAPAQSAFAASLGLDVAQAPALVALAPKKQRTAILTGRFEQARVCAEGRGLPCGGSACSCCWRGGAAACLNFSATPLPAHPHCNRQDSVKDWLDGLLNGRVRTQPLSMLPEFPAAGEGGAEAGADAEEAVEDEFSLEDIMKVGGAGGACGPSRSRGQQLASGRGSGAPMHIPASPLERLHDSPSPLSSTCPP